MIKVYGVVHPRGVTGGRIGKETDWVLKITLEPWRIVGSSINESQLTVHRKVTYENLKAYQAQFSPNTVIGLQVELLHQDQTITELIKVLDSDISDSDLQRRAIEQQQTKTMEDSVFGKLTLNRRIDCWEGSALWGKRLVQLSFVPDESNDIARSLDTARTMWLNQLKWDDQIQDFAVKELLPLKNDSWLDEGETEITKNDFISRITLESVSFYPNGRFELFYIDGDLFWGHAIQVRGSLSLGPTDADIPG